MRLQVIQLRRRGRITLPAEFRSRLGIDEQTLLRITLVGQELRIRPVQVTDATRGSAWAHELYDLFAPVRREAARHSEQEIDAHISRAVAAVRRKRRSHRSSFFRQGDCPCRAE
jgi:bifunctional DNA-binding transcriptional regulator/antitoxin component of YhaV-PrlF toxin-antitoxin module